MVIVAATCSDPTECVLEQVRDSSIQLHRDSRKQIKKIFIFMKEIRLAFQYIYYIVHNE